MRMSGCSSNVLTSPQWSLTPNDFLALSPRSLRLYVVRCARRVLDANATEIASYHQLIPRIVESLERSIDEVDADLDTIRGSTYDISTEYDVADRCRAFVKRSFEGFDIRLLAKEVDTCARFGAFVLSADWGRLVVAQYDAASSHDFRRIRENPEIQLADFGDVWPLENPDLAQAAHEVSVVREEFFRDAEAFCKSGVSRALRRLANYPDAATPFNLLIQEVQHTQFAFQDFRNSQVASHRPERQLYYAISLALAVRRVGGILNSLNRTGSSFLKEVEAVVTEEYDASLAFYLSFKAVRDAIEHMFDRVSNYADANWYELVYRNLVVYSKSTITVGNSIESESKVCSVSLDDCVLNKVLHTRDVIVKAILDTYPE